MDCSVPLLSHVNMYVDDSGLIKKLPINQRASALAVRGCFIHSAPLVTMTAWVGRPSLSNLA